MPWFLAESSTYIKKRCVKGVIEHNILLIDGDPIINQAMSIVLSEKGYEVRVADSARKGLAEAFGNPPDLILIDFILPDKHGLDLLADLRANDELIEVPIILMTESGEKDIVTEAIRRGVTDFILKPFEEDTLIERVNKWAPVEPVDPGEKDPERASQPIQDDSSTEGATP